MIQTILKSHNLNFIIKKDFIAIFLVIKRKKNLDDLTWK